MLISLHCHEINSFLFVSSTKIYRFRAKDSKTKDYALYLGNSSKDVAINNMKQQQQQQQISIKKNC